MSDKADPIINTKVYNNIYSYIFYWNWTSIIIISWQSQVEITTTTPNRQMVKYVLLYHIIIYSYFRRHYHPPQLDSFLSPRNTGHGERRPTRGTAGQPARGLLWPTGLIRCLWISGILLRIHPEVRSSRFPASHPLPPPSAPWSWWW